MKQNGNTLLHRLLRRFTGTWIMDVPSEMSCCEFNCHKLDCAQGDWERCEARLAYERDVLAQTKTEPR